LQKWAQVPPDVAHIQEQNTIQPFTWFDEITKAVLAGEPTVPMRERMAEQDKEMESNPVMNQYRQERDKEMEANPSLKRLYQFDDVVSHFEDITFKLETCQLLDADHARSGFFSSGFPYGGCYALNRLLDYFGFGNIIAENC
jgi:hypothetical protein